jgi:hypothetical protein
MMTMSADRIRDEASKALARKRLLAFTTRTKQGYSVGKLHWLIANVLELVDAGLLDRVALEMPPRHGKSELASIRFPAWYLGKHPEKQFVAASHTQDLADEFSSKTRDILKAATWPFPNVRLSGNAFAVRRWTVEERVSANVWSNRGGVYTPVGVGAGLTGRGADILSIDDPVKDWVQADSDLIRENHWFWYQSVASTRLMPGAAVVMTLTRWHEDDMLGRALKMAEVVADADQWFEVKLPALSSTEEVFAEITVPGKIANHAGLNPSDLLDSEMLIGKLWACVRGETNSTNQDESPTP